MDRSDICDDEAIESTNRPISRGCWAFFRVLVGLLGLVLGLAGLEVVRLCWPLNLWLGVGGGCALLAASCLCLWVAVMGTRSQVDGVVSEIVINAISSIF